MSIRFVCLALGLALAAGCTTPQTPASGCWESHLRQELPRMGHRNFIVVADSAYPLQSAPGIKTLHVGGTQAQALKKVLALLAEQKHVRPVAWVDSEQAAVAEADAPGITQCRADKALHDTYPKEFWDWLDAHDDIRMGLYLTTHPTPPQYVANMAYLWKAVGPARADKYAHLLLAAALRPTSVSATPPPPSFTATPIEQRLAALINQCEFLQAEDPAQERRGRQQWRKPSRR